MHSSVNTYIIIMYRAEKQDVETTNEREREQKKKKVPRLVQCTSVGGMRGAVYQLNKLRIDTNRVYSV